VPSDLELLDAWRTGDKSKGAALFDRHFSALSRFFANKVGAAADDLIQQTLLQCVESRDRFRGEASFRTFLFSVAHNVLRNHFRGKRRDRLDLNFEASAVAELAPGPTTLITDKRQHRMLLEALRRIPVDHQVLLELYYWEPMKAAEIAEVLDVPEGTVRTRLRRAKELVVAELGKLDPLAYRDLDSTLTNLDGWAAELRKSILTEH
jgi:RNA polymerase sigma-70 factor (ECF subfamily)